jgi:capsular polysaccharide biosynthesis protein
MRDLDHLPERLWAYDDYTELDERPAESVTGLTSLGFIRAALRRKAWLWRTMTVAGAVIGLGVALAFHPVYQASATVLLTPMTTNDEEPGTPITNEQAIAQSQTVAGLALTKLGLHESVRSFAASYTVADPTDRVLVITANAPSSSEAVSRASAVATEFLLYRAKLVATQQRLMFSAQNQQINQDKRTLASITAQISRLSAQPASPAQHTRLGSLTKQQTQAANALTALEQTVALDQASTKIANDEVVQGSDVLDPASPLPPHSRLKRALEYAGIGLVGGLALGLGIVVVAALLSDRLRRRDDVAHALGAPVKLSVRSVRVGRAQGLEAAQDISVKRIVAYLGSAVRPGRYGPASLAVVPVDDVRVPAACLVSLAVSYARQGSRVVVADLCGGAPGARLLGVADPGARTVSLYGTQLVVAVPEPDDVVPAGPLHDASGWGRAAEPLVAAYGSADLVLVLAALDPSIGGDHLAGWASAAVAVVTAGRSSAARIRSVGEMVRLAGVQLVSGVLIGADKTDESLGEVPAPDADHDPVTEETSPREGAGLFVTVDEGPGRRPVGDL